VFAAFDLLGRRFIPRLDDIADVPLYGLGPGQPRLAADALLTRRIRDELIAGQWDELLRLAGSIKRGWIVPSILLTRMHADPRPDRLAKALREYGRLVRTNFILDWVGDPDCAPAGSGSSTRARAPTRCTATSASATAAASTPATPSSCSATWTADG
jgi:TnpA family transposase